MKKGSITGEHVIVRHFTRLCGACGSPATQHPYDPKTHDRGGCRATGCARFVMRKARVAP